MPEKLSNPARPLLIDLMPYIAGIVVTAVAFSLDLSGQQDDAVTLAAAGVLLLVLARLAMAVRQNRRLREAAEERAAFDALTGLRNHRYFRERLDGELARARRAKSSVGLLAIDIDRFKDVNDTIGHLGGDRLLSEIGSVLRTNARPSDTPCRVGGDEFAVILPEVDARASPRSPKGSMRPSPRSGLRPPTASRRAISRSRPRSAPACIPRPPQISAR